MREARDRDRLRAPFRCFGGLSRINALIPVSWMASLGKGLNPILTGRMIGPVALLLRWGKSMSHCTAVLASRTRLMGVINQY